MDRESCFDQFHFSAVLSTHQRAKELSCRYFGLKSTACDHLSYECRTLSDLKNHEIIDNGFAHVVRYRLKSSKNSRPSKNTNLYSICLQDHRILDAIKRRQDGVKFEQLMLYIMTHELTHIIRFSTFNQDFDASSFEKEEEEKAVHTINYEILRQLGDPEMDCVLEHYSPFRNSEISMKQ